LGLARNAVADEAPSLDNRRGFVSAAETRDIIELVRRIANGLTILNVERVMQVVMEMAAHGAALRRDPGPGPEVYLKPRA
jgi:ABC-type branched-subunit amino acid transport system ATPase component